MGYECLLAGLPVLASDSDTPITMEELLSQFDEVLSDNDKVLLATLQRSSDDESISEQITQYDDQPHLAPAWWEDARVMLSEQDLRQQLTYVQGLKSRNKFVREWFAYNLDMNNVMVACICRKHQLDVSKAIVGDNEVAQILRKNLPQKDFGLAGIMSDFQEIMALVEENNLMKREKKMDELRFTWLEEHTRFCVFSIENVLAYYLMAQMLNRWTVLTVEQGEKVFRDIVADMKRGANEILK